MHRCSCSTRALESFVKDFAGISLRQQRAQRFFQHHRTVGTRPSRRQLQTTAGGNVNDDFIPFGLESAKRKREGLRRDVEKKDGSQEQSASAERFEGIQDGEEEWHAEVETIREGAALSDGDKPIDTVALNPRHQTEEPTRATVVASLDLPAISQHIPSATTGAPLQKAQPSARMLRKLRRIEEGKFPARHLREKRKEGEDDGTVTDVLKKIDALEGPSVLKKQKQKPESTEGKIAKPKKTTDTSRSYSKDKSGAEKSSATSPSRPEKSQRERWMIEKDAVQRKYGDAGWQPRKRLSPDTLEGIRALHASDPATYSSATLSSHFQITPEAIRRILKSKWQPSAKENVKRMERWERRGLMKWEEMAAQGMRPPKKWRAMGAGHPKVEKERAKTSSGRKTQSQRQWDEAVEAASRLPMEGSFADRIL